jgi:hypothetical protein
MNIQLCSDLHLCWGDLVLPGGDLLIMAGDVFEASHWTKVPAVAKVYNRFIEVELAKYHTVLYVFGNHEHYGSEYNKTRANIQSHMPPNVVILENEYLDLDGVRFWGATLWTDMNRLNPVTMNLAQGAMNDYVHIKHTHRVKQPTGHSYWTSRFTPQDTVTSHKASLQGLKDSLKSNLPHFVITHHAPSQGSVHPMYTGNPLNHCYYTNLENTILDHPNIKHWVHGHTHHPFHYNVGSTQVVCHPRGYYGVDTDDEYTPLQIV